MSKLPTNTEDAEDAEDARDAERIIAGVKSGEIETYPHDVVKQIIDGQNPIRVFREFRNLTIGQLADGAGISLHELGEIEAGARPARAEELDRIAGALKVDVDMIVTALK